ncbi:unnamed protein product [Rotaria socialis]|uniref:Uncharacterized protein n=5 Tax=Rotaria socialis TaxID=392032 RepID=A0A818PZX7_9BILA|nr:unnamed protein product [Rotaria socialis]CAF3629204.1 unnamed protein product [Rotaria socialis]CAF4461286.1 unnamed protein product [Rotaria socialis]
MVKDEQSRNISQPPRISPSVSAVSLTTLPTLPTTMFQTTPGVLSRRLIDLNAIDITSVKGQFAWEKLPQSDACMPVIFRGETKYFCVRMLRKLLPDYPEDFIRRAYQYQYRKPIDLYSVTASEAELLNRINTHHARWTYARQLFNALDELVRVSDFLPLYEHLRHSYKVGTIISNSTAHTLRQLLPPPPLQQQQQQQPHSTVQRSSDYMTNMPIILRGQSTIPQDLPIQIQPYRPSTDFSRENTSRPIAPVPNVPRPPRPSKSIGNPYAILPIRPSQQYPTPPQQPLIPTVSSSIIHSKNAAPSNMTPVSLTSATNSPSSSLSPTVSSSTNDTQSSTSPPVTLSSATRINRKASSSQSTPTTTVSSKACPLHCGWLQINKLYTPYVSTSTTNHHLYKIPVSLISFYDLLKNIKTDGSDAKDSSSSLAQTSISSQEIELINALCIKQSIKPFAVDTTMITLATFYEHCSANILFVKELPSTEPKASICKEWSSIVQINGGICRLRNITTLNEQTVPFIGNNLLKNFMLSSQCLSTASLTKPTSSEIEFLQLILFFSNISINLCNAQLVDIESVQKEYNVDLILLFNDKFPLNVLNYQQQGNRSNTSEGTGTSTNSATNTIAESTPPPSPPSPPTAQSQTNSTSQLSLTSSTNRYYKTIQFHGHELTAYICSGLGTNSQRECVSVKSLCNILYPNSPLLEKLEVKMIRLLRLKNVNRFRPQNQQSIGFTRLIDIKDAEKHWTSLEKEMRSIFPNTEEIHSRTSISSVSNESSKASTAERIEKDAPPSVEVSKGEKRSIDEPLEEEDTPISERINKRIRITEKENDERLSEIPNNKSSPLQIDKTSDANQATDKKRKLPSNRTNKESKAAWIRKYDIEGCCIQLNKSDVMYAIGRD